MSLLVSLCYVPGCANAFVCRASSASTRHNQRTRNEIEEELANPTILAGSISSDNDELSTLLLLDRRAAISGLVAASGGLLLNGGTAVAATDGDDESFASIASRASKLSKDMEKDATKTTTAQRTTDDKTAYDFELPVDGTTLPFREVIHQGTTADGEGTRVKVILVTNMKQDDPIARKTIPQLITLASKYGRGDGGLAIVACPTDQGYYEPDTSKLIRLKLASEYGYGINPSTIVTDKVNLLGSGAHPFWRWLESNCRTPAGLGSIQGNFEKFLVDGRTGLPLRRYPRKYAPSDMAEDIEAVLAGRPLPPARANFLEEWRTAATDAKADTYRFEKGLNYFDQ